MASKLLILGTSGTGKSHSLINMDPKTTVIICPDRKELPFRGSIKNYQEIMMPDNPKKVSIKRSNFIKENNMTTIREYVRIIATARPDIKAIVIDTITYAMIESVMNNIMTKGYDKFSIFADELYKMINDIPNYRDDLTLIFMAHTEIETVDGEKIVSFKVPAGKLTKEKIVPEGLFTTVLYTNCYKEDDKVKYCFMTQNDGTNTCKSPDGMFPAARVENDLAYAIECMQAYYRGEEAPAPRAVVVNDDGTF